MTRSDLHRLVDQLPEMAVDPIGILLDTAPIDDEPLTPEHEAAIAEGLAAAKRGETIPRDQAKSELVSDD